MHRDRLLISGLTMSSFLGAVLRIERGLRDRGAENENPTAYGIVI